MEHLPISSLLRHQWDLMVIVCAHCTKILLILFECLNVQTIDIHVRSQNLHHLDSGMGLKLGVFRFSRNQNNCGSLGVYVTCIYRGPSMKINTRNTVHCAFVLRVFLRVWSAKTRRPKIWAPWLTTPLRWMYRRSGISCVYLWYTHSIRFMELSLLSLIHCAVVNTYLRTFFAFAVFSHLCFKEVLGSSDTNFIHVYLWQFC